MKINELMNRAKPQQVNISPFAILAAILFNLGKVERIKITPADSTEEVEVDVPLVQIAEEPDALVCMVPFDKIAYFMANAHRMELRIEEGVAIIAFEKQESNAVTIVGSNGQAMSTRPSDRLERLTNQLKGM